MPRSVRLVSFFAVGIAACGFARFSEAQPPGSLRSSHAADSPSVIFHDKLYLAHEVGRFPVVTFDYQQPAAVSFSRSQLGFVPGGLAALPNASSLLATQRPGDVTYMSNEVSSRTPSPSQTSISGEKLSLSGYRHGLSVAERPSLNRRGLPWFDLPRNHPFHISEGYSGVEQSPVPLMPGEAAHYRRNYATHLPRTYPESIPTSSPSAIDRGEFLQRDPAFDAAPALVPEREFEDEEENLEEGIDEEIGEPNASISVDFECYGKYVWRGLVLVDDPVFQPAVTFDYKGLYIGGWADMNLTDINGYGGAFDEVRYIAGYFWEGDLLWVDFGVRDYRILVDSTLDTTEVFAEFGLATDWNPALIVFQDVDESSGTYLNFSLERQLAGFYLPGTSLSSEFDLSAAIGWGSSNHNDYNYFVDEAAFTDMRIAFTSVFNVGETVSVALSMQYTTLLDDNIREQIINDDNLFFGCSIFFSH